MFEGSFVKISLISDDDNRILETFRTTERKNDPNPQFNEVTIFKVKTSDFKRVHLKITVYETINNQEFEMGYAIIGPNATDNNHWQHILRQVRRQVISLKPNFQSIYKTIFTILSKFLSKNR